MEGKKVEIQTEEEREEGNSASSPPPSAPPVEEEPAADQPRARVVDRRRVRSEPLEEVSAEGKEGKEGKEGEEESSLKPTYVEQLERKVAAAEEKLREHIERVNRESSEFRARQERELERRTHEARKQAVSGFLGIADDLARATAAAGGEDDDPGRAAEALIQGIQMIRGRFFQELASLGVQPIAVEGQPFDPERHEAVRTVEVDDPRLDGVVVEELGTGYLLGDDVLRPSRVSVGKLRSRA